MLKCLMPLCKASVAYSFLNKKVLKLQFREKKYFVKHFSSCAKIFNFLEKEKTYVNFDSLVKWTDSDCNDSFSLRRCENWMF